MKTEYLSVKDFADRAGVSQQAIYKQLNNKLKKYVKVVENKKYLHISALDEYIKPQENSTDEQQLLNMLQTNLKVLQEQLSVKDRLIEELTQQASEKDKIIADMSKSLLIVQEERKADKFLMVKEKLEEPPTEPIEPDEPPTQEKGFWARIFKK